MASTTHNFQPLKTIETKAVLYHLAFRTGVSDYYAGNPWPRWYGIMYERGRHFAACCTRKELNKNSVAALQNAVNNDYVI